MNASQSPCFLPFTVQQVSCFCWKARKVLCCTREIFAGSILILSKWSIFVLERESRKLKAYT
ncbi:hypothetical protein DPMN_122636 [Dreissena polymorpha]|uniref:Uncharacterized protein n=1 Tax=Dreissena polymorpha TaxID=45954 RepID=A0A9D4GQ41_DREPO|nr:hypothetical protein DPMN_122636 [Dreissena polymorpha]